MHLCAALYKMQLLCQSTHHFLLLSLPLLLDLFSQFVQLILSGQERLERHTNPPQTHTQSVSTFVFIEQSKSHLRNASAVSLYYLHEFVALEYCYGVKYQLAVFNVIFESSHVDLSERHEFLKWREKV